MKQIGNVAALPGIVHVSDSYKEMLFFSSYLPVMIAIQMGTPLWGGVWTKVVGCKAKLSEREASTYFVDCLLTWSFFSITLCCFSLLEPPFPHCSYCLFLGFWFASVVLECIEERRGGVIVACIIVAVLMVVVSFPTHLTLLSLALCNFGSKASDMVMQEENTRLGHFSRSSKYNVEMIILCLILHVLISNR